MIKALIINLDDVLIATSFRDAYPSANIRILEHSVEGVNERFILRPYARHFLSGCRNIAEKVYLVSRTPMERVLSLISTAGLGSCFDNVFAEETLDYTAGNLLLGEDPFVEGLPLEGEYALIDSNSWDDPGVRVKLSFFGVQVAQVIRREIAGDKIDAEENAISEKLMTVEQYCGDPEDCVFLDVLWAFDEAEKQNNTEEDNEGDCCDQGKRTLAD